MVVISPSCPSSSSSSNLPSFFINLPSTPLFFALQYSTSINSFSSSSMEMYATDSSTSLTLQTSNSFRDVSFSSYLNKAEENMIRKLTNQASDPANDHHCRRNNKSQEDEELGVFGAEKYFKSEIEDSENKNKKMNDDHRLIDSYVTRNKMDQVIEDMQDFEQSFPLKLLAIDQTNTHTPSVRSNASCNSRIGLLPRSNQTIERGSKPKTKTKTKSKSRSFLATIGCNCIDKKSTQIQTKQIAKPHVKTLDLDREADNNPPSKLTERKTRNDCFSFPVLNSNDLNSNSSLNSKSGNLAGKVVEGCNNNNKIGGGLTLTLGRKLSLLNDWDVDIPTEDEMYIPSSGMYNRDADSDSSSDLFEIESFSTTGNNSFIDHRRSNCYAPSEVSVDWSVVTASAADFSMVSDYDEVRTAAGGGGGGGGWRISGGNDEEQKKRLGILSGCTSHKAVRVAGNEYKVGGGGAGGRRRLSDTMAIGGVFRGGIV